jgi:hypothetical protein
MEAKLHMLACSEAEIRLISWELESVCACVVREGFSVDELNWYPAMLLEYNLARAIG